MKERPILFSGDMVRAILDGRKTQTRRVCKEQPKGSNYLREATAREAMPFRGQLFVESTHWGRVCDRIQCPQGQPGDRLWVRETFAVEPGLGTVYYRADDNHPEVEDCATWKPSIHMPRKYCRLLLEVKAVRVERLQDISKEDAITEGVYPNEQPPATFDRTYGDTMPVHLFGGLWDSLNAKRGYGWDVNPWVWVIEFERIKP